jgi:ActR/RegA family two-component response regulator
MKWLRRPVQLLRHKEPEVRVVLVSGYGNARADTGAGEFELLGKPYSVEDPASVIRRARG